MQSVFSTSFSWLQIHSTPLLLLITVSVSANHCAKEVRKNIKSQSASGWNRLKPVLSSGQVGCLCSSILQVSISDNDLPSTPSEEVISQTQSFSIFYVSQYCMTHAIWRICDEKPAWIGPKILQHEHIISCRISSQVVWHFVPCSNVSELHFDWLITSEFLQNFFLRFQEFSPKIRFWNHDFESF